MNILLIVKLANHTLTENILTPLLKSSHIDHIYVLRDYPGDMIHEKVTYLPPLKLTKGKVRHIEKIVNGISYCSRYKIDVILGVLITPHGYIGRTLSYITRRPYIHITIAGHREYWVDGKIMEKINLALFKRANTITVTGKQTQTYLESKGVSAERIVIMPNLPNVLYNDVNVSMNNRRTYDIVSFSRIDKNKNVELLLRAVARIKESYPIKLIIAGDGPELDNLKLVVEQLNMRNNVDFVGFITKIEDKIKIYSDSKIFISCSKGEGFPVSLLEAMSCGCVPVVSNVGDIVDVIRQGENGFIFNDTDDEKELAILLQNLLENNELIENTRREAVKIKTIVSVKNNAKTWDSVLSRIHKRK